MINKTTGSVVQKEIFRVYNKRYSPLAFLVAYCLTIISITASIKQSIRLSGMSDKSGSPFTSTFTPVSFLSN